MIGAIATSGTGLNATQTLLDVTSNNLANVNTPGFQAGLVSFQEQLLAAQGGAAPATQLGGVAVAGISQPPLPGPLVPSPENSPATTPTAAGNPLGTVSGQAGTGAAVPGFIEGSNVNPTTEVMNLLIARHTHAANIRAIQVADRMAADSGSLVR
jgi:flagellar basal body rod protein FlgG